MAIMSYVEAKIFHNRNAGDVSNSVRHPAFEIFAKNVLPIFFLGIGDGNTCIAVAIQLRIATEDFRRKSLVGDLLEGRAAIQVRASRVEGCGLLRTSGAFPLSKREIPS